MKWPRYEDRTVRKRVLVLPRALHNWLVTCGLCGWIFFIALSMTPETQGMNSQNLLARPDEQNLVLWASMWLTIICFSLGFLALGTEPAPAPKGSAGEEAVDTDRVVR